MVGKMDTRQKNHFASFTVSLGIKLQQETMKSKEKSK